MNDRDQIVLLTGATGYVGGRLLPLLQAQGVRVRCLARKPENLQHRADEQTEIVGGDLLQADSLADAFRSVKTAYYLVHSMDSSGSFEDQDRRAAENFAEAAKHAGAERIIYLGGLGEDTADLSPHLRSRHEVGDVLRKSGCVVVELRAAIVIGSGSLSFELVRALVQRLPVMICPKWVSVQTQPIAIEDLLQYLVESLDWRGEESRIFEIGGPDAVSYGDIMREYAAQRGLRRWFISVPVLTPRLSSLWLGLVTPVYARVGRKLVDSLKNPTVVKDDSAIEAFSVRPRGLADAIQRALVNEDEKYAQTRWSDALSASRGVFQWGGVRFGNRVVDSRCVTVSVPPAQAFAPIRKIGGKQGWYFGNFLWTLRGWIDLLLGGVGMRRSRRDPEHLNVGEVLDWWRVQEYDADHLLRLSAEMKVPGRAWLEFEVEPCDDGSTIRQTAIFDPIGFFGLAYWYGIYPLHAIMFRGMLRRIAQQAERPASEIERQ
ncbi:MAG: SDR family oxidoreductase [Pirellulaceae bacterium]|nr:SDR family oxidoreductase [Pirellulaceae bacterium]